MLVFIDDSGDPGFKLGFGSTQHLVIAVVVFDDPLEAEKASLAIKTLARDLFGTNFQEWKFNKTKKEHRIQFFKAILPYKFKIRCLIVNKSVIISTKLKTDKKSFYSYAIKLVLQHSNDKIWDAKVKIDGSGDKEFKKSFLEYLRRELNTKNKRIIKSCKMVDSKDNVLIQLADMVAGAIRCSYVGDRTDQLVYKALISDHIDDEWVFG